MAFARALDALTLGEAAAISLGIPLPQVRVVLVAALALATGTAVAQTGMIAFVGLVAPHLVRHLCRPTHTALDLPFQRWPVASCSWPPTLRRAV